MKIISYFTLLVLIPSILLAGIEGLVRVTGIEKLSLKEQESINLDMPTWMLGEKNSSLKVTRLMKNPDDVAWIKLFEQGDGFRAKLKNKVNTYVKNTFTKVEADKENRYSIISNSLGFRGDEPKDARLAVYGDSSSFGWGIDFEKSYSHFLSRRLGWQVANFAIPGDSSEYGKLIAEKYIPKFPKQNTIISFGANDAKFVYYPHRPQIAKFKEDIKLHRLTYFLSKSSSYRTLKNLLTPEVEKPKELPKQTRGVPRKEYKDNLRQLVDLAKENGSDNIILLSVCTPSDYAIVKERVAKEKGVYFLNANSLLLKSIPKIESGELYPKLSREIYNKASKEIAQNKTFWVSWDGCHPNELGNKIIADALFQFFKEGQNLSASEM